MTGGDGRELNRVGGARFQEAVGWLSEKIAELSRSGSASSGWDARHVLFRWAGRLPILLAPGLYLHTIGYEFVWDDFLMIVQNQYFKHVRYIPLYFTSDFARLTSGGLDAVYYRPLFALSFLLDFSLWGNAPAGYHFTNVLLYLVTVWLVLCVSRRLFAEARVAVAAAVLFALHPSHVETVAFVSARNHVLPALGVLLALLGYDRFRHATGAKRWGALAGSLLAFAFGLLSTETAISLPALLACYEMGLGDRKIRPGDQGVRLRLLPILPHLALGLGFLWFRWTAVESVADTGLGPGVLWQRLPGALEVLARSTVLAVWPFRMQPAYIQARPESLLALWPVVGLAIAAGGALAVLAWRRRRPEPAFALGWFLITLAPVADLIPLAPRALNLADRYVFIPSLGICWLLAMGGTSLWDRARARSRRTAVAFGVTVGGVLLAWTGSTLTYASVWQDNITLFSRAVRDLPHSAFGYNNLGLALVRAGRITEAIGALEAAVRLEPTEIRSQLSLARTYVEHGRAPEGFRILDRLESRAGHEKMYFMVRARAHMAVEEWDAAYQVLSRGLQRFPELAEGYQALGLVLERQEKVQEAMEAYRRAVRLRPDLTWSHLGLARIQLHLGEPREAASAARAALAIAPDDPVAAWILTEAEGRIRGAEGSSPSREP